MAVLRFIWSWVLPVWGAIALVCVIAEMSGLFVLGSPNYSAAPPQSDAEYRLNSPDESLTLVLRESGESRTLEGEARSIIGSLHLDTGDGGPGYWLGRVSWPASMSDRGFGSLRAVWLTDRRIQLSPCGVELTGVRHTAALSTEGEPDFLHVEVTVDEDCGLAPHDPLAGSTARVILQGDGT